MHTFISRRRGAWARHLGHKLTHKTAVPFAGGGFRELFFDHVHWSSHLFPGSVAHACQVDPHVGVFARCARSYSDRIPTRYRSLNAPDSFASARAAIEASIADQRADSRVDPRCTSILMHHGRTTDRALVLFHGFTNCPRQFRQFAELAYGQGYTVYVPLLPRHGMLDKLTTALAGLTVDELVQSATDAADFARSLGRTTTVMGLSVGATLAAWLAQTHPIDRAIAIAPFFSVAHVPSLAEPVLAGALAFAPNVELWWDPRHRERVGPEHGYPRFPTHALARCLQLGERIRDLAHDAAPRALRTTLVLNAKDPAIDNAAAQHVLDLWRGRAADVDLYVFENLDARHDIIEPTTYADAAALVYPVLAAMLAA